MDSNSLVIDREDKEERFERCWACGSLVLKTRIEKHHILGKEYGQDKITLCILCHDVVDRIALDDINIFYEFLSNTMQEVHEIFKSEPTKYKWVKLFILKVAKIQTWRISENSFKDKQNTLNNTPPTQEQEQQS